MFANAGPSNEPSLWAHRSQSHVITAIITAISFASLCATVIVKRLNAWKSESNNTFLDPSSILLPRTTAKAFPVLAKPTCVHNNFTNSPLVNIFLTMPNASDEKLWEEKSFTLRLLQILYHQTSILKECIRIRCARKEHIFC